MCPFVSLLLPAAARESRGGSRSCRCEGEESEEDFSDKTGMHRSKKSFQFYSPPVPHPAEKICLYPERLISSGAQPFLPVVAVLSLLYLPIWGAV